MKYGYARVSTKDQDPQTQIKELIRHGVPEENIFHEKISGAKKEKERPQLKALLEEVEKGDEIYITKLDRLGRSTEELFSIAKQLENKGVTLNNNGAPYNPNDPMGKMFFGMLAVIAEFERDLIIDRTKARLEYLQKEGRQLGRKKATNPTQEKIILEMIDNGYSYREISDTVGVSRTLIGRIKKDAETKENYDNDPQLRREIRQRTEQERLNREKALKKYAKIYSKTQEPTDPQEETE